MTKQVTRRTSAAIDLVHKLTGVEAIDVMDIECLPALRKVLQTAFKGLALADNLHIIEANEAFVKAVEVDPGFAMGYLRLAQTSQSAAAFANTWATSCCPRETAPERQRATIVR